MLKNLNIFNHCRHPRRLNVILNNLRMSSGVSNDEVILEKIGGAGVITLNRPKALNALNLSMIRTIYPQLKKWEEDASLRMVIIKGNGEKAFCAGGDIRAVYDAGKSGDPLTEHFFKEEYILNNAIGTLHVPWVALIDGITMGGGVGLSVHGQYRIATERTLFAMPETAIGLLPDVGGGYFLPRLGGKLGIYLALTGFRLKGIDVQKSGVATHYVRSDKLNDLTKELLALENASPKAIATIIECYHKQDLETDNREFVLKSKMNDINRLFSASTLEGIYEALEKEGSEWATQQLNTLKKMSPTSMKLSLRQLQEGAKMSLQDVLQMEYRLVQRCMQDKDFYEGVRAVLVDKDQKPKWDPSRIEDVREEKLDSYFSKLPEDKDLVL